ncbi:pyridoxamine 5'-phosphate oxidase family protein [uncultured Tateyamaria sp.]|uniref:pyridoxamine 5'-phosphate oxidase family protein n=1 Tax=uncultured Tateyamaria sp. TaxID=455651 RepID=UPI002613609A|nr:pyridoxamine 5'-phosphate oxidase family protein [uncultured Tateyamaria sp.]
MEFIEDIPALEALYGTPGQPSLRKVADHLTPLYAEWIAASRFVVLTTVGPDGTDGSPRGDDGPVVLQLDPKTLALPDWRGNQRLDSLRNIVEDGRVSLMFMVPGSNTVVRVNGEARLTADEGLRQQFEQKGRHPATVIVIRVGEVYTQCARALIRSGLWLRDDAKSLPTPGEILAEVSEGDEGGASYDAAWPERAARTMW